MLQRISALLFCLAFVLPAEVTAENKRLVFSPHWVPQAQFAGYYAALDQGFYAEAGLDVEIIHPSFAVNAIEFIKNGQADVMSNFMVTAMTARSQGLDLVNFAQLSQHSGIMLVTRKESGIEDISDFHGRSIGVWMSGFEEVPKAMMIEHGIEVEWIPILWSVNLFLMGGIDAMTVMWYNEYNQIYLNGLDSDELNVFFLADYGYDVPEDGLYTLRQTHESRAEELRAFVGATLKGWEYVARNRDYAVNMVVEMMRKMHIPSNFAHQRWMLDRVIELQQPGSKMVEPGFLHPDDYALAVSILTERGIIKQACGFDVFFKPLLPLPDQISQP